MHVVVCALCVQAEFPEGTELSKQIMTHITKWDPRPKTSDSKGGLSSCSTLILVTSLAAALLAGGVALYAGR